MAPEPEHHRRSRRILAIDPCNAGIAFVVLEGDAFLVDRGIALVWSKALSAVVARVGQLVEVFPELLELLPPPRRPWMSEDARINIFDALGWAMAACRS